jgi:hypothetical protein
MYRGKLIVITMFVLGLSACAQQRTLQEGPNPRETSKTKLEAFQAKTGTVIVTGFTEVGAIPDSYGGSITVESKEFTDGESGKKEYGITIGVKGGGELQREGVSYIDYDEIESLVKGIDYISGVKPSVTKLHDFQADYRTKGGFKISTFSSKDGQINAAVSSGSIGEVDAFISLTQLDDLRGLIIKAKATLDEIRSGNQ